MVRFHRARRSSLWCLGLALFATPGVASAGTTGAQRVALRLEGGAGTMLSSYQQNVLDYHVGIDAAARIAVNLVDPLEIQASASMWFFPSGMNETGRMIAPMLGLRFDPRVGRIGRPFVEANAGVGFTGPVTRFTFDAAVGFEFAPTEFFGIGPFVRYGHIVQAPGSPPGDAQFWAAGLAITLRVPGGNAPEAPSGPADADRDAVLDADDRCPTEPAGASPDPRRAGCPARDADGDGVADYQDLCANEPEGARPDPSQRGCPLRDQDGDGVADRDDQCANVAAGAHPDSTRRGCPAVDADNDGVFDDQDRCPSQAAGRAPDPARPGCPAPDRDNDSIPDREDHCPDQAGAPSREANRNGCPGLVRVTEGQIRILRPVYFAPMREVILDESFPVLAAVADAVLAMQVSVRVEGHTDDRGNDRRNMQLSQRRADSIARWLTDHGVPAQSVTSVGYGETRPIEPNSTALGRAANRRVEFHIVLPGTTP